MIRATINGLGRIGRTSLRVFLGSREMQQKLDIVAINTSGSMDGEGWAMLLKHDTAYHALHNRLEWEEIRKPKEVTESDPEIGTFIIDGKRYPVLAQRDPSKLPWKKYQVDLVLACTGVFRTADKAGLPIQAGARRVLISAPGKGGDIETLLSGVTRDISSKNVMSCASCTTNSVAPVMDVLHRELTVKKASLTTIHAYTDGQNLQDGSHKDPYRGRAAAANLVPTSTGAAKAVGKVIPDLEGIFDGMAVRTPVITGSLSDIVALVGRETSIEEVNDLLRRASESPEKKGILGVTTEPLVSSDIIGSPYSCVVALPFTNVIAGDMVKVLAWYDNEWGYCCRLMDLACEVG